MENFLDMYKCRTLCVNLLSGLNQHTVPKNGASAATHIKKLEII